MRLIGLITLACMIAVRPAVAFERFAHLQPSRETMPLPATEAEAQAHPENLAAKLQQDKFDRRIQIAGRKAIRSLCTPCLASENAGLGINRARKFDLHEGSTASAEAIYSRDKGFDPALAGGQ